MGKGKYKRKRERAEKRTEHETLQAGPLKSEVVHAQQKTPSKPTNSKGKDKDGDSMRLGERTKRYGITDWLVAIFTGGLLAIAIYQFIVMGGQLDVMRKDQRPWIKLGFDTLVLQVQSPIGGNFRMVNNGKTVAKDIKGRFAIERVENGQQPRLDYGNAWINFTGGTIFPNDPQDRGMTMKQTVEKAGITSIEDAILSQPDFNAYMAGDIFYVAYAKVSYSDFFGIQHWTQFCSFLTPTGNTNKMVTAKNCTDYNDIDDN